MSEDELNLLAEDVRKNIIDNCSKNGGHLASSLGVVELTVALHHFFDLPKDKGTILTELRRNAMHYMMTARDIANEYGIPYIQAQDIYTSLNEDSNGIVREYKLPENSTESFLV